MGRVNVVKIKEENYTKRGVKETDIVKEASKQNGVLQDE